MSSRQDARKVLESAAIHWQRDWDALVIGFVLGALTAALLGFTARVFLDPPTVWTHDHQEESR